MPLVGMASLMLHTITGTLVRIQFPAPSSSNRRQGDRWWRIVLLRSGAVEPLRKWDLAGSLGELLVATPWEAGSPTRRSWGPRSVLLLVR